MDSRRHILVVNRTARNAALLRSFLESRGYTAVTAGSLEEMDAALDGSGNFGLALIDVSGFGSDIWRRCSDLYEKGIPFVVIAPISGSTGREEGLRRGARGVLTKPLAMKELSHLIESMLA